MEKVLLKKIKIPRGCWSRGLNSPFSVLVLLGGGGERAASESPLFYCPCTKLGTKASFLL